MLDNASNQLSKFGTENWVQINDDSIGTYNPNKQIKFKTTMPKSSLCDYSDAYILFKGKITVNNTGTVAAPNNRSKKVIFKNCAPFTNCIIEINKTQTDNAKDIDIAIIIQKHLEAYNIPGIPAVNNNGDIVNFNGANATDSFNSKAKITCQTDKMEK